MAVNRTTLADEDGDFSNWLEIHNSGASPVNLAGWHLTDNQGNLDKWTFPSVNLPAGGRLVVFASNKDRASAGSPLHTNFRLAANGGYLALVRPDLTIASQFASYPNQVADVSYGVGLNQSGSPILLTGAAAHVPVPADGSLGTSWTAAGFDHSTWNSSLVRNLPSLVITEAGTGEPDFVEVQKRVRQHFEHLGLVGRSQCQHSRQSKRSQLHALGHAGDDSARAGPLPHR